MMSFSPRRAGILLHPTSLPSSTGIGEIGPEARLFADWLFDSQVQVWQILPLVPVGSGHSPYSSGSAFATNPLLISLDDLKSEGWVTDQEISQCTGHSPDRVDYDLMIQQKTTVLRQAALRWKTHQNQNPSEEWIQFQAKQADWIEDTALFYHLTHVHQAPWWTWPTKVKNRAPSTIKHLKEKYQIEIEIFKIIQFFFEKQWQSLRNYCSQRQISIVGDLPIYVDHHSADVWMNQNLFCLVDGLPTYVSGVPPDAFSETGQLWGNPIYRWDILKEQDYQWWIRRFERVFELTDCVRVDHFRAFSAYWQVPYGAKDACGGEWIDGPKMDFFNIVAHHFGTLPIIAEDLGMIDQPVLDLIEKTGLPGMKVLHFAFGDGPNNAYLPHRHTVDCVVYTGTHDNDTTRGWWGTLDEPTRDHIRRYIGVDGHDLTWDLIRVALASVSQLAVIPLQDLLNLGNDTRMNTPGVGEGNWRWRVRHNAFNTSVSQRLKELITLYNRHRKA
jgi:4-alpha-glucanotransferase